MSEKQYDIKIDGDRVTISEVEPHYHDPGVLNPNPTFREKIGFKMRCLTKTNKILFVLMGNIYGILHRWGSNRGVLFILSFFQFAVQAVMMIMLNNCFSDILKMNAEDWQKWIDQFFHALFHYRTANMHVELWLMIGFSILWIIDLISVIAVGEIRFLGHKRYPDYRG